MQCFILGRIIINRLTSIGAKAPQVIYGNNDEETRPRKIAF